MLQTLMTSCMHHVPCMHWHASHPQVLMTCQKLLIGILFTLAEQSLLKLTAPHFCTQNNENANKNMMKRILIAVSHKNKANFNENFRTYSQESVGCLYKQETRIGLLEWSYLNYNFSFGPVWTHKIKTKAKYISTPDILHLSSAAGPVPHAEPIPASLVISFINISKFFCQQQL